MYPNKGTLTFGLTNVYIKDIARILCQSTRLRISVNGIINISVNTRFSYKHNILQNLLLKLRYKLEEMLYKKKKCSDSIQIEK